MLQRAIEIVFRNKFLIVLPLLIILPITIIATLMPRNPEWRASTTVWVDQYKPLYQDDRLGYTPAANQAQLLSDFIHTQSFTRSVLAQTPLASSLGDPKSEERAEQSFWRSVQVSPISSNFVLISVTMRDPDLAYGVAQAIDTTYLVTLQKRLEDQTAVAGKLYGDVLGQAQRALDTSQSQLAIYLALHPEATLGVRGGDPALPLTLRNSDLGILGQQVSQNQETYNGARQQYLDAQQKAAAGHDAQPFAFTVIDQPQRPVAPVRPRTLDRLKLPVIGLVLGLLLSSGIAALFVYTDHRILDSRDVQIFTGLPVVGVVSEMGNSRRMFSRRQDPGVRIQVATPARRFR